MSDFVDLHVDSQRLVGVELEYDAGTMEFRQPDSIPPGWLTKSDASLRNGYEFVLDPPVTVSEYRPIAKQWADAWDPVKIALSSRGSFHVHLGAHDCGPSEAFRVVSLYTRFQPVIDQLVGKSRLNNRFCPPYDASTLTESFLVAKFDLDDPATSRSSAKSASREFSVVNCAMLRCSNPDHRSFEFRQCSPSRRYSVVYGWPCFLTVLTELAIDSRLHAMAMEYPPTLPGLKTMVGLHPTSQGIGDWLQWRWEHLNAPITEDVVGKAHHVLTGTMGLNTVASKMDLSYPRAANLVQILIDQGLAERSGSKIMFLMDQESDGVLTELSSFS